MGGICQIWNTPHIWQTLVTNLIRDVFHDGAWVYRGPYSTKPGDKHRPIWSITSGWDLSYMGGFVIYGWVLSNMGSYILRPRHEIRREWDLSPRFVIYGEYLRFDKSHPCMTNPSTPRWLGKNTSSLLDQWESSILIMWPLFDQSQGSISGS